MAMACCRLPVEMHWECSGHTPVQRPLVEEGNERGKDLLSTRSHTQEFNPVGVEETIGCGRVEANPVECTCTEVSSRYMYIHGQLEITFELCYCLPVLCLVHASQRYFPAFIPSGIIISRMEYGVYSLAMRGRSVAIGNNTCTDTSTVPSAYSKQVLKYMYRTCIPYMCSRTGGTGHEFKPVLGFPDSDETVWISLDQFGFFCSEY